MSWILNLSFSVTNVTNSHHFKQLFFALRSAMKLEDESGSGRHFSILFIGTSLLTGTRAYFVRGLLVTSSLVAR